MYVSKDDDRCIIELAGEAIALRRVASPALYISFNSSYVRM